MDEAGGSDGMPEGIGSSNGCAGELVPSLHGALAVGASMVEGGRREGSGSIAFAVGMPTLAVVISPSNAATSAFATSAGDCDEGSACNKGSATLLDI